MSEKKKSIQTLRPNDNGRRIFQQAQAAMASPASSKLSPVENTVAPGRRKHCSESNPAQLRHTSRQTFEIRARFWET